MTLEDTDNETLERLGYDKDTRGVFIASVEADSEAARLGLTKGLLILKVTNTPVKTVAQFKAAVDAAKNAEGVRLYVASPDGGRRSVFLPLPDADTADKNKADDSADEETDDTGEE
jgi:serine protease Do